MAPFFGDCGSEGNVTGTILDWVVLVSALLNPMPFSAKAALLAEFANGHRVALGREYSLENRNGAVSGPLFLRINDWGTYDNSGTARPTTTAMGR